MSPLLRRRALRRLGRRARGLPSVGVREAVVDVSLIPYDFAPVSDGQPGRHEPSVLIDFTYVELLALTRDRVASAQIREHASGRGQRFLVCCHSGCLSYSRRGVPIRTRRVLSGSLTLEGGTPSMLAGGLLIASLSSPNSRSALLWSVARAVRASAVERFFCSTTASFAARRGRLFFSQESRQLVALVSPLQARSALRHSLVPVGLSCANFASFATPLRASRDLPPLFLASPPCAPTSVAACRAERWSMTPMAASSHAAWCGLRCWVA